MKIELPKQFDPQEAQRRWLQLWTERNYGHSRPDPARKPFTIVIPPPNVTGALHMGHALNNTLQDVLIRWRRMQGFNAEWMPGTDHAGIATQAVVERRIREEEGKTRHDLGRDELVRRIWQWKDQYEARILGQLRSLGCSCDWQRTRFTFDEGCSRAVRTTFFNWFRDGYIYRGKRLVNWDTQLQTSVSDDETYTEEIKGKFWTFKYPIKELQGEWVRFSTTRPETMLGDTAICVHPDDDRYRHLIGKTALIPLVNREIPIIADGLLADPTLGTGCVKVTPAHDPNDHACWQRHPEIGIINILNPDGTINENGGKYQGVDRYKAREAVVADMEALGLFEGQEERMIPLAFSDRSKTPIEPYLSDQWFVRMGDLPDGRPGLARMAMEAVIDGRVKFYPERYAQTYLDWLAEKRDWCISRQLWWGHRIPVWSKAGQVHFNRGSPNEAKHPGGTFVWQESKWAKHGCAHQQMFSGNIEGSGFHQTLDLVCVPPMDATQEASLIANLEAEGFSQDPDVLDTWFSSQLWPHSTFGWPERTPELDYYYPTDVLVTSRDIITLWVARMVLSGLYNMGDVPFRQVYITPKLLDGFGETMSKSKGNGVDPLDIIDRYGADALRFQMVYIAGETQDSRLPVANVCPNCQELIPVKQEHMYMRTRKVNCPKCKKPFRPGGPWPADDSELPTAKQASERFEMGRNFATKLWNAARMALLNMDGYRPEAFRIADLPQEDRWLLSRLQATAASVTEGLESYHFADVARNLYEFVWSEFCDWHLEMCKGRLKNPETRPMAQRVLIGALDVIVRLVHPVMPFVTESLWQAMNESAFERGLPAPEPSADSVMIAPWPALPTEWRDAEVEARIGRLQELVRTVREIRNEYMVDDRQTVDLVVRCSPEVAEELRGVQAFIQQLAMVGALTCGPDIARPKQASSKVHEWSTAYVSLAGLIDIEKERGRLQKQLADRRKQAQTGQAKLSSPAFVQGAPPEVVQKQRDAVRELEKQIAALEENIAALSS